MQMYVGVTGFGEQTLVGVLQAVTVQDGAVGYIIELDVDTRYFFERGDRRIRMPKKPSDEFLVALRNTINQFHGHTTEQTGAPKSLGEAIIEQLEAGPKTADDLALACDSTKRSVQSLICRLKQTHAITKTGSYYALA